MATRNEDITRLAAKTTTDPETGCWLWGGYRDGWGYGRVWFNGRLCGAHRASYELHRGPIPDGLQIDHLCRVPACINPAHMEPVTALVNVRRAGPATKMHCVNGHFYDEQNTYRSPLGRRFCRTCNRAAAKALKAKKRGAL